MSRLSDAALALLISELERYQSEGVFDPWVVSDGTLIDPLDVLRELRDRRDEETARIEREEANWADEEIE